MREASAGEYEKVLARHNIVARRICILWDINSERDSQINQWAGQKETPGQAVKPRLEFLFQLQNPDYLLG